MSSVGGGVDPSVCVVCASPEVVYVTEGEEPRFLCRHCVARLEGLRARSDWTEARHARVMRLGPRLSYRWTQQIQQVLSELRWMLEQDGEGQE